MAPTLYPATANPARIAKGIDLTKALLPHRRDEGPEPCQLRRKLFIGHIAGKFKLRKSAFLLDARPEMREQGSIADDDDACFWPSFGNRQE